MNRRRFFLLLLLVGVEHLHKLPVGDKAVLVLVEVCEHLLGLSHGQPVADVGHEILEVVTPDAASPSDVQGPE